MKDIIKFSPKIWTFHSRYVNCICTKEKSVNSRGKLRVRGKEGGRQTTSMRHGETKVLTLLRAV